MCVCVCVCVRACVRACFEGNIVDRIASLSHFVKLLIYAPVIRGGIIRGGIIRGAIIKVQNMYSV